MTDHQELQAWCVCAACTVRIVGVYQDPTHPVWRVLLARERSGAGYVLQCVAAVCCCAHLFRPTSPVAMEPVTFL